MVDQSTSRRRFHPLKAHLSQIEHIGKHLDHANSVALVNEIIKSSRHSGNSVHCPRSACSTKRLTSSPRRITRESEQHRRFHTARVNKCGAKSVGLLKKTLSIAVKSASGKCGQSSVQRPRKAPQCCPIAACLRISPRRFWLARRVSHSLIVG
jgi:hypothetical protein